MLYAVFLAGLDSVDREANTTLLVRDMHPVIYMTGGSSCPQSESMKASTAMQFICDTSVDAGDQFPRCGPVRPATDNELLVPGEPLLVAQLPPEDDDACAFFIEWRTKVCYAPSFGLYIFLNASTARMSPS